MTGKDRIAFVDSDPEVLADLRGQASLLGDGWEPEFLDNAESALEAFGRHPCQAVVAALDLPGMDGGALLQEVMARHPATIRILAADPGDRNRALPCLGRVHQFLTRPCDLATLGPVLDFLAAQGRRVGNDHVRELVARIGQLPTLPALYQELIALLESDRGSVEAAGAIVSRDVAMTAMLLKLANSAFFGVRQRITSAAEAVSYLGLDLLKALVLAHGLFRQFGALRVPGFSIQQLWRHSLAVAAAARSLAETEGQAGSPGDCFTAGLLHDVGILILASRFPDDYAKAMELTRRSGTDLEASEYYVFRATHGEVGGYLLALWGLPGPLVEAATFHHLVQRQPKRAFTPALAVHVADYLYGRQPDHEIFSHTRLNESYLAELGLLGRLTTWTLAAQEALALGLE